jgi:nicotinate-nucleotide pyrophosphorylase (carboxylating)
MMSMRHAPPPLSDFLTHDALDALLARARDEDLGPKGLDVTSRYCIPPDLDETGWLRSRAAGRLAGLAVLPQIAAIYDAKLSVTLETTDGCVVQSNETVARLDGPLRSMLAMERIALNLLGHLSGIATLTGQFVEAVSHTHAAILDTRKTLPGLRALEKYAVACGGGVNHRMGLYDAMLIKDNHLAHLPASDLTTELRRAIKAARQEHPELKFIEVEVDDLKQLEAVLTLDVDIVLLDNMTPHQLAQAVALRDARAPAIQLEASGGIDLEQAAIVADSGVDRISVGALTHSPPTLDLGLDLR